MVAEDAASFGTSVEKRLLGSMKSEVMTSKLCMLNLPLGTDWWKLNEFVLKHTSHPGPRSIWVAEGYTSCWGIVEFHNVQLARNACEALNNKEYAPGYCIYVRQDRDDRYLAPACKNCGIYRNQGLRGEWWGKEWFCWSCVTVSPLASDQVVFDTHCHLDEVLKCYALNDHELLDAIACLSTANVTCITSCCDREGAHQTERLVTLARKVPNVRVFAAFGIHPKKAEQWDEEYVIMLEQAIKDCGDRAVAWGECGLDFSLFAENLEGHTEEIQLQKRVLEDNIRIAEVKQLPLVLHTRDCESDFVDLLEKCMARDQPAQIHCAILSTAAVKRLVSHFPRVYFGLAGYLTKEAARAWPAELTIDGTSILDLFSMVEEIPMERIVLETDAPAFRVESGGPCDVLHTAEVVARIKHLPHSFVVDQCVRNAQKLYGV